MWIRKGTLNSKLVRSTPKERDWLQKYLTFPVKGADGREEKVRLFNAISNKYPAGFDASIVRKAAEDGFEVVFIDKREAPVEFDESADLAWLHDYQHKAIQSVARHKRGILWLPTGAGKGEIAVALMKALPCTWLVLAHRSQLADEIARRYEKNTGLAAGRILEGQWLIPPDARIVCATFHSLMAALRRPPRDFRHEAAERLITQSQGLLVDECHVVPAGQFLKIIKRTGSAYYRVGLSGTPLSRGDQKNMFAIGAIGPVLYRVRPKLLIERGVLAKPTVHMVECLQHEKRASTYHGVKGELITKSTFRNKVVLHAATQAKRPGFIFVNETDHGKAIEKALLQAGIPAIFVWGKAPLKRRLSLIRELVRGRYEFIVCSSIFNEGVDVPELRSVIVAAGGKSLIAVFQRMGRGMRVDRDKATGKVREGGGAFEVWDILDQGNKWTEKHAQQRLAAYASESFDTFTHPTPASAFKRAMRAKKP